MPAPLIAPRWRAGALLAIAVGALVTGWLSIASYHSASTSFDTWVLRTAYRHLGVGAADALLALSEPAVTIGLIAAVSLVAAILRRWELAIFAALGPLLAVVATELILKPIVGRLIGPDVYRGGGLEGAISGAFPSGHETGVTCAAIVLFIAATQWPAPRATRLALSGVLVVWTLLSAVGLVRNFYHYATDTIGAIAASVAVVLAVALAVDRWVAPLRQRLGERQGQ